MLQNLVLHTLSIMQNFLTLQVSKMTCMMFVLDISKSLISKS